LNHRIHNRQSAWLTDPPDEFPITKARKLEGERDQVHNGPPVPGGSKKTKVTRRQTQDSRVYIYIYIYIAMVNIVYADSITIQEAEAGSCPELKNQDDPRRGESTKELAKSMMKVTVEGRW